MDVTVRPAESKEGVALATVSGFYGSAIAPSGSSAIMWAGDQGGAPDDDGDGPGKDKPGKDKPPAQPPGGTNPPTIPPQEQE